MPHQTHRADRPQRWGWALAAFAAGVGAYGLSHLIASVPTFARVAQAAGAGSLLSRPLSLITGTLPFAAGEVLAVTYVAWLLASGIVALHATVRRRRRWANAFAGGVRRGIRDVGIMLLIFYTVWGLNYAWPDLDVGEGKPDGNDIEVEEWIALAENATAALNRAYFDLHGAVDAGSPTTVMAARDVEIAIDEGWQRAAKALALPRTASRRYGRVKFPLISPLLERLGITGIYFPFTAEANVLRGLPGAYLPQTMAHEKAHQRGFALEAEASFVGFVAAALAPHPAARYSAALYAQSALVGPLLRAAPAESRRIRTLRHPGVQRDLDDAAAYFARHRGRASAIGMAMNDRYLRANRVPGGIRNYGSSRLLLVAYARSNGGEVLPFPATEPAPAPE